MNHWTSRVAAAAAIILTAGFSAGFSGAALAQAGYPDKPIRLVVPFPPGGGTDVIGRIVSDKLSTLSGWKVVVDNKAGAGGTIGLDSVAKSKPDGYTLVLGQTSNLSIAPSIISGLPYDPVKDFAPVRLVASIPLVIVVGANSPIKSLADLVATAKTNPGKILFASSGNGTVGHLAGELFQKTAGIKFTHVPYKGMAQALPDLISGRASLLINSVESIGAQVKSGQLRAIAVASLTRSPQFPEVPTIAESGFPGFEAITWFGIAVPAGTPAPIIARLDKEIAKVLDAPDVKERLNGNVNVGPAAFAALIKSEHDKWAALIKEAGIPGAQ